MDLKITPVFGFDQPGSGRPRIIKLSGMPAKHKLVSHAARKTRKLLVENLNARIRAAYPTLSITAAYERIGDDTGIALYTFQRIMSGNAGPSIDTLSDIAHNLGCSIGDLLSPRKDALPAAPSGVVAQHLHHRRG